MPSAMCGFPEKADSHKNTTGSAELLYLDREMRREYAQKIRQNPLRLVFKSPSQSSFQKPSYFSNELCFISSAWLPAGFPHWKLFFSCKMAALHLGEADMGEPQPWASKAALVVQNPPANAGNIRDAGSIPGSGRFRGEGNDNPLQSSCLENPMARGAWRATI